MLIKWCKIQHLSLDKALLFPRNQVISLKNWKLWGPTTKAFNISSEILHKFASYQCLQMGVRDFSISLRSWVIGTTQKMKFAIKDFSSKCDQIRRYLRIWSYLLEKSLMENFIFVQWVVLLKEINYQVRSRTSNHCASQKRAKIESWVIYHKSNSKNHNNIRIE